MDKGKKMKPIDLTENLRIVVFDKSNYAIERRNVAKAGKTAGKVTWGAIAFYPSTKGLTEGARVRVQDEYAAIARKKAGEIFDRNELGARISALPTKPSK